MSKSGVSLDNGHHETVMKIVCAKVYSLAEVLVKSFHFQIRYMSQVSHGIPRICRIGSLQNSAQTFTEIRDGLPQKSVDFRK